MQLPFEPPQARTGAIALVAPESPVDRLYSFGIPAALAARVLPGVRVRIPFGRHSRIIFGWCIECSTGTWDHSLREIVDVVDERPLLSAPMLELVRWIGRYYACPLSLAMRAAAPTAARASPAMRRERVVHLMPVGECGAAGAAESNTSPAKQAVACKPPGTRSQRESAVVQALRDAGGAMPLKVLIEESGVGAGTINRMAEDKMLRLENRLLARAPAAVPEEKQEPDLALNDDQSAAVDRIAEAMSPSAFKVHVLFGVTGSGKTEVYIHAIRRAIALGRQAILLVPEIALTTQTVARLSRRFPRVAVLHSGLTDGQRARAWRAARNGEADLVVGTRSAVFAPCPRLGLIVVDEEHETSYKNQAAPRYHMRDVAIMRGKIEGIPVVLGSASPSLETWNNAGRFKHYETLRLPRRAGGLTLPRVAVVDLRAEQRQRRGIQLLSRPLEQALTATLARGEQAVLLLNRRGFANYLFCPGCDNPIVCPNCGVCMVFHRTTDMAHCHYCQARMVVPQRCVMAGCNGTLVRFGMGTQRVEDELRLKCPTARVARMDSDAMAQASDYADVLGRFERGELDVLVGTQMIAKGLDYPRVTCVGVINADTALSIQDFRSTERTFQLVLQVAGRCGRSERISDVVIQTFNSQLPAIVHAAAGAYETFAAEELASRRRTRLPPHVRLVRLVLGDPRMSAVRDEAAALSIRLREALFKHKLGGVVSDAHPCQTERLRNEYRFDVLLSFDSGGALVETMDRLRADQLLRARCRSFLIDVDPLSMT